MTIVETDLKLNHLAENPEMLIPQRLKDISPIPNTIKAVNFRTWIGTLDNGYQPHLSTIIYAQDAFPEAVERQEDDKDNWGHSLNYNRLRCIRQELMTVNDEALIALIAADRPYSGVYIETYLDAARLRGHGVGKTFFPHLNNLLSQMGYRYLLGINNEDNVEFFRRFGNYTLSQLDIHKVKINPFIFFNTTQPKVTTIHFFDKQMEEEFVKPEFLKP